MKAELKEEFERQAGWRDQKALEYPGDGRNAEAANLFRRLAATVDDCPQEVVDAAWELFEDAPDSEEWLEMMKEIGFHAWPKSAEEFCRRFIAKRTS